MSIEWVRSNYGVPAKRGGRVEYNPFKDARGKFGTITGTRGPYLLIRLDGSKHSGSYHPTWQLRYLDAGDPAQ
ncbi:hypothetical protein ACFFTN_01330 [Aminobacter aganoensis]|uniref:Uncharacterized protein n=1 Tax=Aminobacter aganoensis TaxID=83264 RepID=A0A7X0F5J2_9HYPH|nr:hypothetical protein [Aminobacter aganoensis]MBB6353499.1 hypothetical protein [Aminobacter aganoensis]